MTPDQAALWRERLRWIRCVRHLLEQLALARGGFDPGVSQALDLIVESEERLEADLAKPEDPA